MPKKQPVSIIVSPMISFKLWLGGYLSLARKKWKLWVTAHQFQTVNKFNRQVSLMHNLSLYELNSAV